MRRRLELRRHLVRTSCSIFLTVVVQRPVFAFTNTQGQLPFDDPCVRVLLGKVKSGHFQMHNSFSEMAKDFIGRLLVVDPQARLTIQQMKQHPYFNLGLPVDYVIPKPLPIPSFLNPVNVEAIPEEVRDILHKIGYIDDNELNADLTSPQHSMAKVFFYMLTARVAIDELDWSQSVGGANPMGQASEEPLFMYPSLSSFSEGIDPFHRMNGSMLGNSYEAASLAFRPEWAMPDTEAMEVMQQFDIVTHVNLVQTMRACQIVVSQLEMQWFHPDDFMVIARHQDMGIYVVFQCLNVRDLPMDTETRLQIQLCRGTIESFNVVCHKTEEVISQIQSNAQSC